MDFQENGGNTHLCVISGTVQDDEPQPTEENCEKLRGVVGEIEPGDEEKHEVAGFQGRTEGRGDGGGRDADEENVEDCVNNIPALHQ